FSMQRRSAGVVPHAATPNQPLVLPTGNTRVLFTGFPEIFYNNPSSSLHRERLSFAASTSHVPARRSLMPQPGMQREHPEPANPAARAGDELVSPDAVMNAFAQACLAIPAIGAVIGVRDLQGIRCVISFGKAPPVGSRIGSEPEFSKRCIENGEVVLCDDLAADPCPPGIAGDALPGAAVAIPIFVHSEVAGVIELWSFEPFSIHPGVIGELKQVADSFA